MFTENFDYPSTSKKLPILPTLANKTLVAILRNARAYPGGDPIAHTSVREGGSWEEAVKITT